MNSLPIIILVAIAGVSPQQDQTAVAGISTNINIQCLDLGRQVTAPFWFINGTVYELFSIPQFFPSIPVIRSYTVLTIPIVILDLDNTTFLCATFNMNGDLQSTPESATRLIVQPNPFGHNDNIPDLTNQIDFNYQKLNIQENVTIIQWSYKKICNTLFEIQGFTIVNGEVTMLSSAHIIQVGGTSYEIPADQFLTSTRELVYFRVVAVNESGVVCSDVTSQRTYFRFDGITQTSVQAPNSTACFHIPPESASCPAASIYFTWPQNSELSCICPTFNSTDGRSVFHSCVSGCNSSITPQLTESGEVCLPVESPLENETTLNYQCSTDPCTEDCFVKNIVSSHRIVIAGPPSAPDITYNGSSLCISAYSHREFPVESFNIEVNDVTGVSTSLTGSYNTTSPLCFDVQFNETPCLPAQVFAAATNAIGTNTSMTVIGDAVTNCSCYQQREQINLNITSITTNSAIVTLTCGLEETRAVNYSLIDLQHGVQSVITLLCGESSNLTDLRPSTQYSLRRHYSVEISCDEEFTTDMQSKIELSTRLGASFDITCDLPNQSPFGIPLWYINDTIFGPLNLRQVIPSASNLTSFDSLTIATVTTDLNNTCFQCANLIGNRLIVGVSVILIIDESLIGGGEPGGEMNNSIIFEYDRLEITNATIHIEWRTVNICTEFIQLQGFYWETDGSSEPVNTNRTINTTLNYFDFSSSYVTDEGVPLAFRIVAVNSDGDTPCSNSETKKTFYRFGASRPITTSVLAPNDTKTFMIPTATGLLCERITGTWSPDCICDNLFNPSGCGCQYTPTLNRTSLRFTAIEDELVINFLCVHQACVQCTDILMVTVLESHKILRAGPPSALNVIYNGSVLCFSAFSYDEFPVQSFTVEVTDVTGVPSDLSGTYNASSPCLSVITTSSETDEIVPDICLPFQVSLIATNTLENSSKTFTFPSVDGNEGSEDVNCTCYQQREQVVVTISNVSTNSAVVELSCKVQEISTANYVLYEQGGERSIPISLMCGQSRNLTNLMENTQYVLTRNYTDQIQCSIAFTTIGPPRKPNANYTEDSLCFSSRVQEMPPVDNFTITFTDVTAIPSSLSSTYSTAGPQCIRVEVGPAHNNLTIPNLCLPFNVSVSATNAIGTSDSFTLNVSEIGSCLCYQQREQTNITTQSSANSIAVELHCARESILKREYSLEDQEGQVVNSSISLECGKEKMILRLMPNTQYQLIRHYSNHIRCNFTIETSSNENSTIIAATIVSVVMVIGIIFGIGIIAACCFKKRSKKLEDKCKRQPNEPEQPKDKRQTFHDHLSMKSTET